jgi:adenosylcobinamide amidohydrolase
MPTGGSIKCCPLIKTSDSDHRWLNIWNLSQNAYQILYMFLQPNVAQPITMLISRQRPDRGIGILGPDDRKDPLVRPINLTKGVLLESTENHIHVQFDTLRPVISSAVLNGGAVLANHILNLNVRNRSKHNLDVRQSPDITLAEYCRVCGWSGTTVGMMTAASMDSFRMVRASEQGVEIFVLVTVGLSNVRRAGDIAEHRKIGLQPSDTGTINIICLPTARLTPSAMVEAVITVTEAKTAALQNRGIKSPVSDTPATGTGTDAVAISSGRGPVKISYCGKHVLFGEILAKLVIEAVDSSIRGAG